MSKLKKSLNKNVGLIGAGCWGINIMRNLYELDNLYAVCDSNINAITGLKDKYPDISFCNQISEILEDRDVKAVAVATPANTHYEIVKKALSAGKDVFVEKPLALTVKQGEELHELAKKNNSILMVGHVLQYHPAVKKLKELISGDALGKIQYLYSNRLNIGKLRTEENILWSFAPHDISLMLELAGEFPINVSASGDAYVTNGIYDTTLTALEFKNGIKGHIFVSWLHPFKEQKLIVVGSKAMAVFDDTTDEKLFIYHHKVNWTDGKIPVVNKADRQTVNVDKTEPLKEELKHFIECVANRAKPKTDGAEGVRVLRVLELAEKSLSSNPMSISKNKIETEGYFVHDSSFLDDGVLIGKGTKIWNFSHVLKNATIGNNCSIGKYVEIGPDVKIGDNCKIQNNVSVFSGVTIEDDVFCGPSCVFTNVYNPRAFIERKHEFRPTLIRKGATIGANATIVCGITIGRFAMIGAGAVVKIDVADYAVVAGVPSKQIGWVCKCGVTLKDFSDDNEVVCKECKNKYHLQDDKIISIEEK